MRWAEKCRHWQAAPGGRGRRKKEKKKLENFQVKIWSYCCPKEICGSDSWALDFRVRSASQCKMTVTARPLLFTLKNVARPFSTWTTCGWALGRNGLSGWAAVSVPCGLLGRRNAAQASAGSITRPPTRDEAASSLLHTPSLESDKVWLQFLPLFPTSTGFTQ